MDEETYFPTLAFGFAGVKNEELYQLWVGSLGHQDWRKVPMIELGKTAPKVQSIAGYVPAEEEDE
jgi:hypothetical protein